MITNGLIIMIGGKLFPVDLDLNNMMEVKEVKPFITPFLAHAIGSLAGAFAGALIAKNKQFVAMFIVSVHYLGGLAMVISFPAPTWFVVNDLLMAYLPMGYLGWKLANRATTA